MKLVSIKLFIFTLIIALFCIGNETYSQEKNIMDFIDLSLQDQIQSGIYTNLDSASLTTAIQKAFDSIPSGGSIYFPAGIYIVTHGFQLFDGTMVRGESREKVIIRLQERLPARTNEATQSAFFTGKNAYSLSQTGGTNRITIQDLSLDANRAHDPNIALLGGIRLINPAHCKIRNIDIANVQNFGISLYANKNGQGATNNQVIGNSIHLVREWYLPDGGINQASLIGIELGSAVYGQNNGAEKNLTRKSGQYLASKASENLFEGNFVEGGSHAIVLVNAAKNIVRHNTTTNSSHRGIMLISTSDQNIIEDNRLSDHGSTGIHLAYNSDNNTIRKNRVQGTRAIAEGDGIKAYGNCNRNSITGNVVVDVAKAGIRLGHGANDNTIRDNEISNTKGILPLTVGIKISAAFEAQLKSKIRFMDDRGVKAPLTANRNQVVGNKITGTYFGIVLTDDAKIPGSVKNNTINRNAISNTFRAIHSNGVVGSQINNVISLNIFHKNDWDVVTDFLKLNKVFSNISSHAK
jgi:parallel beta-helix repeat protein